MSPIAAHAICLGLAALDLVVRSWRIQWLVRGLGHRMGFGDAFLLNVFGDAASALTPLRIGGEPARLAWMLRCRLPAVAAFVALSLEALITWPVVAAVGAWLVWQYAPAWWATAGPRLAAMASDAWPWVVVVALLSLIAWAYARRLTAPLARHLRRPIKRALVYWRRMPRWPLLVSIPATLVHVAARVAMLPVLVLALSSPPALGPTTFGSFALLYSQLLLPTPSGAGAVELGFLGGAAGDLGDDQPWLLLAWRFYTNGLVVVLGIALAVRIYGWPVLRRAIRRVEKAEA